MTRVVWLKPLTRQMTWYFPREVFKTKFGLGTGVDPRRYEDGRETYAYSLEEMHGLLKALSEPARTIDLCNTHRLG